MKKRIQNSAPVLRASAGLTLIELTAVLMLIVLTAALIVPSAAAALRRGGAAQAGNELAELARFAAVSAITKHAPATLNIDTDRGRCWVSMSPVRLPWQEYGEEETPRGSVLASMKVEEGVTLQVTNTSGSEPEGEGAESAATWNTITFQATGAAQDAQIEVEDRHGQIFELEVLGATGAIRTSQTTHETRPQ